MKQIPLNSDLIAKIKAVVGPDVETEGLAVFEAVALNTRPIPGKDGSFYEAATATPLTLREMADYINQNGLPLAEDHSTAGPAKGRVFYAEYRTETDGLVLSGELRVLFYLDPTETVRIQKLNAGVVDEVSVSFLGKALLCSECGWDYLGEDSDFFENIYKRTCANGHEIGSDGAHLIISGLDKFQEISLVQRGAASNAKIVGKSQATLTPQSLALAAKSFEAGYLFVQASAGDATVDFEALLAKLTTATSDAAVAKAQATAAEAALTAANTQIATLTARVSELETQVADPTLATELTEARTALTAQFNALVTACGETAEAPTTVAALTAGINERTAKLTALIPVGGAAQAAGTTTETPKVDLTAFKISK